MARRRNYKRDRSGRFARTGSTRRPISGRAKTAAKVGLTVALIATAGVKAGSAGIRASNSRSAARARANFRASDWM